MSEKMLVDSFKWVKNTSQFNSLAEKNKFQKSNIFKLPFS